MAKCFDKPLCPNQDQHTQSPVGYIQWHAWADKMMKTHKSQKCPGCGRWAIWVEK